MMADSAGAIFTPGTQSIFTRFSQDLAASLGPKGKGLGLFNDDEEIAMAEKTLEEAGLSRVTPSLSIRDSVRRSSIQTNLSDAFGASAKPNDITAAQFLATAPVAALPQTQGQLLQERRQSLQAELAFASSSTVLGAAGPPRVIPLARPYDTSLAAFAPGKTTSPLTYRPQPLVTPRQAQQETQVAAAVQHQSLQRVFPAAGSQTALPTAGYTLSAAVPSSRGTSPPRVRAASRVIGGLLKQVDAHLTAISETLPPAGAGATTAFHGNSTNANAFLGILPFSSNSNSRSNSPSSSSSSSSLSTVSLNDYNQALLNRASQLNKAAESALNKEISRQRRREEKEREDYYDERREQVASLPRKLSPRRDHSSESTANNSSAVSESIAAAIDSLAQEMRRAMAMNMTVNASTVPPAVPAQPVAPPPATASPSSWSRLAAAAATMPTAAAAQQQQPVAVQLLSAPAASATGASAADPMRVTPSPQVHLPLPVPAPSVAAVGPHTPLAGAVTGRSTSRTAVSGTSTLQPPSTPAAFLADRLHRDLRAATESTAEAATAISGLATSMAEGKLNALKQQQQQSQHVQQQQRPKVVDDDTQKAVLESSSYRLLSSVLPSLESIQEGVDALVGAKDDELKQKERELLQAKEEAGRRLNELTLQWSQKWKKMEEDKEKLLEIAEKEKAKRKALSLEVEALRLASAKKGGATRETTVTADEEEPAPAVAMQIPSPPQAASSSQAQLPAATAPTMMLTKDLILTALKGVSDDALASAGLTRINKQQPPPTFDVSSSGFPIEEVQYLRQREAEQAAELAEARIALAALQREKHETEELLSRAQHDKKDLEHQLFLRELEGGGSASKNAGFSGAGATAEVLEKTPAPRQAHVPRLNLNGQSNLRERTPSPLKPLGSRGGPNNTKDEAAVLSPQEAALLRTELETLKNRLAIAEEGRLAAEKEAKELRQSAISAGLSRTPAKNGSSSSSSASEQGSRTTADLEYQLDALVRELQSLKRAEESHVEEIRRLEKEKLSLQQRRVKDEEMNRRLLASKDKQWQELLDKERQNFALRLQEEVEKEELRLESEHKQKLADVKRKHLEDLRSQRHKLKEEQATVMKEAVSQAIITTKREDEESFAARFRAQEEEYRAQLDIVREKMELALSTAREERLLRRLVLSRLHSLQGSIRVCVRIRPPQALLLQQQHKHGKKAARGATVVAAPTTGPAAVEAVDDGFGVGASGQVAIYTASPGTGSNQPNMVTEFDFDSVFPPSGPGASQRAVWDNVRPLIEGALRGYNACCFAYGQTSSGKTHTMLGSPGEPGIAVRAIKHLFAAAKRRGQMMTGASAVAEAKKKEGRRNSVTFALSDDDEDNEEGEDVDGEDRRGTDSYGTSAADATNGDDNRDDDGASGGTTRSGYSISLSCYEVYCERVLDLLSPTASASSATTSAGLPCRETPSGVEIAGLTRICVRSSRQALDLIKRAANNRKMASHGLNAHSSRSHMVTKIWLEGPAPRLGGGAVAEAVAPVSAPTAFDDDGSTTSSAGEAQAAAAAALFNPYSETEGVRSRADSFDSMRIPASSSSNKARIASTINLIDLAGSERITRTDSTSGDLLKEANFINSSLSTLGLVISSLRQGKSHVPFRDSKLTFLLKDSLSAASAKVLLLACVSPDPQDANESLCTLNFASKCRSTALSGSGNGASKKSSFAGQGGAAAAASGSGDYFDFAMGLSSSSSAASTFTSVQRNVLISPGTLSATPVIVPPSSRQGATQGATTNSARGRGGIAGATSTFGATGASGSRTRSASIASNASNGTNGGGRGHVASSFVGDANQQHKRASSVTSSLSASVTGLNRTNGRR
jgi:Kinesin motor domain